MPRIQMNFAKTVATGSYEHEQSMPRVRQIHPSPDSFSRYSIGLMAKIITKLEIIRFGQVGLDPSLGLPASARGTTSGSIQNPHFLQ